VVAAGVVASLISESNWRERLREQPPSNIRPSRPAREGIWLSSAEVDRLRMSGPAWENIKRTADAPLPPARMLDIASRHDTSTLAVALVAVRTGDPAYRRKAADAIRAVIGTEKGQPVQGSRHLSIARNTTSYVIAADLIDLEAHESAVDDRFRAWIKGLRDDTSGEGSIRDIHETRSNNHGTMAGAARAAISRYLGDQADLARTAQVLKGWMGDRESFRFEDYPSDSETYMADPSQPRPVNPPGATKDGHNVDGLQVAEHARCGAFQWPPCYTVYPWGGLGGAVVAAEILHRAGYSDIYAWESRALLRAYTRLHELAQLDPAWWERGTGDESWQPWLANYAYRTNFPAVSPSRPGNNMGWTDWTHGSATAGD
jgi:hypothetical protein